MQKIVVQKEIAGKMLSIETGTLAKLADASVTVQYGETVVFAAVVRAKPREGIDFFPLQVDYRERRAAAGKFPGGFFKREGRPTNREILISRLIDRPLRPLFPKGFMDEVQVQVSTLSYDRENDPDMLAGIAAGAALAISDIPFNGPTAHVRAGRINGQFVVMPTITQMGDADLDVVVSGTNEHVNMIEVAAQEVPEEQVADGIEAAHACVKEITQMVAELVSKAGKTKVGVIAEPDAALVKKVRTKAAEKLRKIKGQPGKEERGLQVDALLASVMADLAPTPGEDAPYGAFVKQKQIASAVKSIFSQVEEEVTRETILQGIRPDGRDFTTIRPITSQVGLLPRVHGSALFSRGETQSLCTLTLGTSDDEQMVDGLAEEYYEKFMLHYNFPSYSVGEVRPIRGPGRREVGHGALAEKALAAVIPSVEVFPYTIRIISDVMESNGSSSMASTCGGCLALLDAGVPITSPVAGISIGLVQEKGKHVLLTDIIGEEDHYGDMDFKVCGTRTGVTAIQLDIKIDGLSHAIIRESLTRAREARMQILDLMAQTISGPRPQISPFAPKLVVLKIEQDMIGKLIGPGGRTIKKLQEDTQTTVEVKDDGTVYVSAEDLSAVEGARQLIQTMCQGVKVGQLFHARVVSIKDFGAFVELAPDTDGLLHVSEYSHEYIRNIGDVLKVGDEIDVKVILVDDTGRVKVSRKVLLDPPAPKEGMIVEGPAGEGGVGGGESSGGERRDYHGGGDRRGGGGGGRGGDRRGGGGRGGDRGGRGGGRR